MRIKPRHADDRVFLLPNLFTSGNLFFGFFALISSINGFYKRACFAILLATVFDMLDGRIARFTKSFSKFGEEFDSLTDLISFGLAPAVLIFFWSGLNSAPSPLNRFGWLASFFFIACGALRLARYNTQPKEQDFVGLPIPVAAGTLVSGALFYMEFDQNWHLEYISLAVTIGLGFLMVSRIPYKGYKDLEIRQRRPFPILVLLVLLVSLMIIRPEGILFTLSATYVLFGGIWGALTKKRIEKKKSASSLIPIIRPLEKARSESQ